MMAAVRQLALLLALSAALPAQQQPLRLGPGLTTSQVIPRNGNSGSLNVSGEAGSDGPVFATITSRGATVSPWTNREVGRASNSKWAAQLAGIPVGGPYRIAFHLNRNAQTEVVVDDVYVGDIWVLAGQSNMVGRAPLDAPEPPHPMVRMQLPDMRWSIAQEPLHERKEGADGEPIGAGSALTFAKEMIQRTGIPIGLIACAKGGTNLTQWDPEKKDSQSLYGALLHKVAAAGGKVAGILWYQGEADCRDTRAHLFADRFQKLVSSLRADLHAPNLPFYYAQLARFAGEELSGHTVQSEEIVREAQRKAESQIPHSLLLATIDLELGDHIHLDAPSQRRMGRRFAAAVCADRFAGNVQCPAKTRGPRLDSIRWESPYRLRIHFSQANGKLQSTGRPLGFSIADEAGTPRQLVFRVDLQGSDAVLSFNRLYPFPKKMFLWYGRGFDPACNLTDESDLAVPAFGPMELPARPGGDKETGTAQ
ncbi:MAG: sialate O-acetylesterase [Bryobacteraceae bacterium]